MGLAAGSSAYDRRNQQQTAGALAQPTEAADCMSQMQTQHQSLISQRRQQQTAEPPSQPAQAVDRPQRQLGKSNGSGNNLCSQQQKVSTTSQLAQAAELEPPLRPPQGVSPADASVSQLQAVNASTLRKAEAALTSKKAASQSATGAESACGMQHDGNASQSQPENASSPFLPQRLVTAVNAKQTASVLMPGQEQTSRAQLQGGSLHHAQESAERRVIRQVIVADSCCIEAISSQSCKPHKAEDTQADAAVTCPQHNAAGSRHSSIDDAAANEGSPLCSTGTAASQSTQSRVSSDPGLESSVMASQPLTDRQSACLQLFKASPWQPQRQLATLQHQGSIAEGIQLDTAVRLLQPDAGTLQQSPTHASSLVSSTVRQQAHAQITQPVLDAPLACKSSSSTGMNPQVTAVMQLQSHNEAAQLRTDICAPLSHNGLARSEDDGENESEVAASDMSTNNCSG